jgi:GNAT superfamily N-acetyltransferase
MMTTDQSATVTLRDGRIVVVRPIAACDVELERSFIAGLSPQSRRFRFLATFKTPSDELLKRLTDIDTAKEAAFVALTSDSAQRQEVGVARFSADADGSAEIAVTVADKWQGNGLATTLMNRLIDVARRRGVRRLYSVDAADNHAMSDLAKHLGFSSRRDPDDARQVIHSLELHTPAGSRS